MRELRLSLLVDILREKGLSLDILVLREAGLTFVIFMEEELSLNTIERCVVSSRYIEGGGGVG